ncbi:MAG: ATP-dependent DNA ligase [Nitrososphaerota archaeon]|nr:ATP-dependent DNA ligase [Candidatus Geocrenenecus dongiae]
MVLFREFAEVCEKLREISGRKDKISLIIRFFRELNVDEVEWASRFLIGRPLHEFTDKDLNIGYATIMEIWDNQATLLVTEPPTLLEVAETFTKIAEIEGRGSRGKKRSILSSLLSRMSEIEKEWFTKILIGEMQHGVNEGVLLEALAEMVNVSLDSIRRAYMLIGDIGELAKIVLGRGGEGIESIKLSLYKPLRPMLAEQCDNLDELFRESNVTYAVEFKVDGARVHIHLGGEGVKIFTRRLNEITHSAPDVVEQVKKYVKPCKAILDGEIIAVDSSGRPLPFQALLRRFKKKEERTSTNEISLKLFLFDILYLDGKELIDLPYVKRWEILEEVAHPDILIPRKIVKSRRELEEFLKKAINSGHEGVMVKKLDSVYKPGRREDLWLKVKPADTLDLVIVAADWGYGRRTGWLSNYHLAAYNPDTGRYEVVGKTFKGLTDEEFEWITKKLLELKIREYGYTVIVKPEIVVEVAYNEIQKSRKYSSGLALRFARITKIRTDKKPYEASTIQELRERYIKQFEKKAALL